MTFTESKENNDKAINKLITKCWEDEAFKQELIANPVPTMEKFYGGKLKKAGNVQVVDQTDTSKVYINIPAQPNFDDVELTDNELEAIAGGWFVSLLWTGVCFGDGEPGGTEVSYTPPED